MSFWDWLWFCDNCGTSPGGSMPGMSVSINPRCPECQHHRCKFCTVEAVDTRKITEMPRERSSPLRPDPRPHPMMPTMSLALLQKIPAENSGLVCSGSSFEPIESLWADATELTRVALVVLQFHNKKASKYQSIYRIIAIEAMSIHRKYRIT